MDDYYIRLFWPEIYMSYSKVSYDYSKTGIDFIDEDYWSGVKLE